MSESFRLAAVMAVIGGFLESYSFLLHGHVFANAQTGNMALCGMALDFSRLVGYGAKFHNPRSTAERMKELSEGEEE